MFSNVRLLLLIVFFGVSVSAARKDIHVNQDVFVCGSNQILPAGCEVKPDSIFTVSANPNAPAFSAIINQDLLEKLSIDDQVFVWWGLALDLEQALFEFEKSRSALGYEFEFDLVKSRDFIECWLDSNCKPHDLKSFHQFSVKMKLHYFEQSGVLIPNDLIKLQPWGLIQSSKRIVNVLDHNVNEIFRLLIQLPNQRPNQTAFIRPAYQGLFDQK